LTEQVAIAWMQVDPQGAETWLQRTDLPEERKRTILIGENSPDS
jgi:hypothetical protein